MGVVQTGTDQLVLVSSDGHIGPRLIEDLRPHCPSAYLDEFDAFAVHGSKTRVDVLEYTSSKRALMNVGEGLPMYLPTEGHHDIAARLDDMNRDGVAASILFHGSQNCQPIPFVEPYNPALSLPMSFETMNLELAEVGFDIYNRWIADVTSLEPERHIGLAYIPAWDIDKSMKVITKAREDGFRAINWPAYRKGMKTLNDPAWDPFWALAADLEMPLVSHGGVATDADHGTGPGSEALRTFESGGWLSRRGIWWLVLSGVFQRHPALKYAIVENPGAWWHPLMEELDSFRGLQLDKPPSEYCRTNVFHGASFISAREAAAAVEFGYDTNTMWGSDYPHLEGTWRPEHGEEPQTHLALRNSFAGLPADAVARMVGLNAVELFKLDLDALTKIAARINVPTMERLQRPLRPDEVPSNPGHAFRTGLWS